MGNFLQLTFQRIKMGWQFTMSAMTRLATLAGRAMSLALSAMGWVGMIYMAVEAIKAWKKSQEEVDEAAEKLVPQFFAASKSIISERMPKRVFPALSSSSKKSRTSSLSKIPSGLAFNPLAANKLFPVL